jgi:HEAT repeat protein
MKAYAAKSLGELRDGSSETVEGLIGLLKDKNSFARQEAMKALGRIGPPAAVALEALEAILSDHHMDALSKGLAAEAIRAIHGSTSAPM